MGLGDCPIFSEGLVTVNSRWILGGSEPMDCRIHQWVPACVVIVGASIDK